MAVNISDAARGPARGPIDTADTPLPFSLVKLFSPVFRFEDIEIFRVLEKQPR